MLVATTTVETLTNCNPEIRRAMAAIIPVVFSAIFHLKACMNSRMNLDALIKVSKQTQTTILNAVSASTCELPMETASVLIACMSDDLELFSREGRSTGTYRQHPQHDQAERHGLPRQHR